MKLIDKIRKIKFKRLSVPEKLLYSIFDGIEIYNGYENPNIFYFKKNGYNYFCYNKKYRELYYDYDDIFIKIQSYFNYNNRITGDFVGRWVLNHIKIKVDLTIDYKCVDDKDVEERINLSKIVSCITMYNILEEHDVDGTKIGYVELN
jgi:hypothetical protein